MNVKSGITITPNYSETKMKHHSEVNFGKSRRKLEKYQH